MHTLTATGYQKLIKPILFRFSADRVHELFLHVGHVFGAFPPLRALTSLMWKYESPLLNQELMGLIFKNPIGLSAGFDYHADLVEVLPSIGFGFNTIGTLTLEAYEGNPAPMLGRLPKSKSLLVNKGFKNEGVVAVLSRIKGVVHTDPRGVSIGATNKPYADFEAMLSNLVEGFKAADQFDTFDYYELNISCPNLLNIQNLKEQLASVSGLTKTLTALSKLNLTRPVWIKMPLERSLEDTTALAEVASTFPLVEGLIFSNLAKDRTNPRFDKEEIAKAGKGNFSGKPTEEWSNELLRHVFKTFGKRFVLIGVGGVFTAEDAYKKILLGASLVQLITGMIYMGPQQIGVINKGLVTLLKRDGYSTITDAIGTKA